jgi:hypothetical protein
LASGLFHPHHAPSWDFRTSVYSLVCRQGSCFSRHPAKATDIALSFLSDPGAGPCRQKVCQVPCKRLDLLRCQPPGSAWVFPPPLKASEAAHLHERILPNNLASLPVDNDLLQRTLWNVMDALIIPPIFDIPVRTNGLDLNSLPRLPQCQNKQDFILICDS